jgi:Ty3 transposon capsid-like protein/Zinc knuckle
MATQATSNRKEIGINKPTPFTGDRKKVATFIQEAKVYLTINKDIYNNDETKIAFMLSYMTDKEALQWKELYIEQITDAVGDLIFPTFNQFLNDLKEAFRAADRTGDAMNALNNLKQGNKTAEELSTEFRLLAGQAGLEAKSHSDHIHLIGLFRNALRPSLSRRILFGEVVPKTIEEWIAKAIQYDTNYRMAIALTGQTNRMTGNTNRNRWTPRTTETKDPNAMDIDNMTIEERSKLMKQGACFNCKQRGHMAKDCPNKKSHSFPSKKLSAKDLITQIRAMTKEEKNDFVNLMMDEKDETGF